MPVKLDSGSGHLHDQPLIVLAKVTRARAAVLRELAWGLTEREAAEHLDMTVNGFRSCVRELRGITGLASGRELGRWWRNSRPLWLRMMAEAAGTEDTAAR